MTRADIQESPEVKYDDFFMSMSSMRMSRLSPLTRHYWTTPVLVIDILLTELRIEAVGRIAFCCGDISASVFYGGELFIIKYFRLELFNNIITITLICLFSIVITFL